jgi:hypothetical protein
LSGCATTPDSSVEAKGIPDPLFKDVLKMANAIHESNIEANRIAMAAKSGGVLNDTALLDFTAAGLPELWKKEVRLLSGWNGKLLPFLEMISKTGGLDTPLILGKSPPTGKLILVSSGKRRLIDFLADAGHQAGSAVTVMPLFSQDRVQIIFKNDGEK